MSNQSKVSVCLWFDGQAEEAAELYTSIIPNSEIITVSPVMIVFTLDGAPFQALNGGPQYKHSEAASITVSTNDQKETDYFWEALISNGGEAGQCAWLKDRFGVSWQIVPTALPRLLGSADREAANRALQAMFKMSKIDIAALEAAYAGEP